MVIVVVYVMVVALVVVVDWHFRCDLYLTDLPLPNLYGNGFHN